MKTWNPNLVIPMDVDGVLDYELDFTPWLEGGALAGAFAVAKDCTTSQPVITGNVIKFRVSALIADQASIRLRMTTADGQVDYFTVRFAANKQ